MNITFLGTGTSIGVPIPGCNCQTCISDNPKNRRYRSSIYIEIKDISLLIDTTPELRLQLLENNITKIDAILFTHAHADHIMGFDDIRAINRLNRKVVPCYGNQTTISEIKRTFNYIFNTGQIGGGIPQVRLHNIDSCFTISGVQITPLPVKHGKLNILGYKIKNMAYITDCSIIPVTTLELIKDIDVLIIDALRHRSHPTHMNIKKVLSVIKKLNLSNCYLTHLSHDIKHEIDNRKLPENVQLAYDRLKINV